jgi:hypothetical protein
LQANVGLHPGPAAAVDYRSSKDGNVKNGGTLLAVNESPMMRQNA